MKLALPLLACALFVCSGCVTRGPTEDQVAQVTEGKTKDEVRAILGPPNFVDFESDGTEKWVYSISHSYYRGPYVPTKYELTTITIMFQGDVVTKIGRGETKI